MIGLSTHGFIHSDLQNEVNAALQIQPQVYALLQAARNTVLPDRRDGLSPVIAEKNKGRKATITTTMTISFVPRFFCMAKSFL